MNKTCSINSDKLCITKDLTHVQEIFFCFLRGERLKQEKEQRKLNRIEQRKSFQMISVFLKLINMKDYKFGN